MTPHQKALAKIGVYGAALIASYLTTWALVFIPVMLLEFFYKVDPDNR